MTFADRRRPGRPAHLDCTCGHDYEHHAAPNEYRPLAGQCWYCGLGKCTCYRYQPADLAADLIENLLDLIAERAQRAHYIDRDDDDLIARARHWLNQQEDPR